MRPRVSVVVPTFRRAHLLERCLRALRAQTLPRSDFEILVVDDASEEAVRTRVETLAAGSGVSLRYLRPPPGRRGPAAARNAGWRAARAPIVAFTDDDTIPVSGWLACGLAAMAGGAAAAAGRMHVPVRQPPTDYERNVKQMEGSEFVTANCFVRRDALERIGGFDERFRRAWREDSDLHFALLERYGGVARAQRAVVLHPVRPARWGVSLREQANVVYDALLYKKHPALYRARIRPFPPFDYYLTTATALLVIPVAVSGHPSIAAALAALWLGLTARLAARRLRGTSRAPAHLLEMLATSALIPLLSVYWRVTGALRFRARFV